MTRALVAIVLAVLLAAGGYYAGSRRTHSDKATAPSPEKQAERKVLYWHDPMYPQQKFDKPGKSPFMDMQLVPVYADDKGGEAGVTVSSRAQQNLGMRTAPAEVTEIRQE